MWNALNIAHPCDGARGRKTLLPGNHFFEAVISLEVERDDLSNKLSFAALADDILLHSIAVNEFKAAVFTDYFCMTPSPLYTLPTRFKPLLLRVSPFPCLLYTSPSPRD